MPKSTTSIVPTVRRRFLGLGGEKREEYALNRRDTSPLFAGPFAGPCPWCIAGDAHSLQLHYAALYEVAVAGRRDELYESICDAVEHLHWLRAEYAASWKEELLLADLEAILDIETRRLEVAIGEPGGQDDR